MAIRMQIGSAGLDDSVSHEQLQQIEGWRLRLRLVEASDAAYIHRLRTDTRYNKHLSAVTGGVAEQREWIEEYKRREAAGLEYYYIIERLDDCSPCGVVRLYDIEGDCFTWGSWILDANKPSKAALESAVLSFALGFRGLGARLALIDVRRENARALAFYRGFGMIETGEDADNCYFEYPRERFERDEPGYSTLLLEGATA